MTVDDINYGKIFFYHTGLPHIAPDIIYKLKRRGFSRDCKYICTILEKINVADNRLMDVHPVCNDLHLEIYKKIFLTFEDCLNDMYNL